MPPRRDGRGHRFAAYPLCSADRGEVERRTRPGRRCSTEGCSARRCLRLGRPRGDAPSRFLAGRAFARGPRPADEHPWLIRSEAVIASLFSEAQLLVERIVGDDLGSDASLFSEAMVVGYSEPEHHLRTPQAQPRPSRYHRERGRAWPSVAWAGQAQHGASDEAAEQGVEADEAEHNGASQLNSSVRRTYSAGQQARHAKGG